MKSSLSKWWDGYTDQAIVIIEDVDHTAAKYLSHCIKIWTDEAAFYAETKGGTLFIRPRGVIVTPNYDVNELWPNDVVLCQAISRQFAVFVVHNRDQFKDVQWQVPQRIPARLSIWTSRATPCSTGSFSNWQRHSMLRTLRHKISNCGLWFLLL